MDLLFSLASVPCCSSETAILVANRRAVASEHAEESPDDSVELPCTKNPSEAASILSEVVFAVVTIVVVVFVSEAKPGEENLCEAVCTDAAVACCFSLEQPRERQVEGNA